MSITDHIATLLQNDIQIAIEDVLGVEHGSAETMAELVFKHLQKNWGGREIWIPADNKQQRNEKIKHDFNGRNHAEICRFYRISLRQLYRITKYIKYDV